MTRPKPANPSDSNENLTSFEKDLLKDFEEPINFDELTDTETVFRELEKKYGLSGKAPLVKKNS